MGKPTTPTAVRELSPAEFIDWSQQLEMAVVDCRHLGSIAKQISDCELLVVMIERVGSILREAEGVTATADKHFVAIARLTMIHPELHAAWNGLIRKTWHELAIDYCRNARNDLFWAADKNHTAEVWGGRRDRFNPDVIRVNIRAVIDYLAAIPDVDIQPVTVGLQRERILFESRVDGTKASGKRRGRPSTADRNAAMLQDFEAGVAASKWKTAAAFRRDRHPDMTDEAVCYALRKAREQRAAKEIAAK